MVKRTVSIAFFSIFLVTHTDSMIMRNNALMSKMVSQFQGKDNRQDRTNEYTSLEPRTPENPHVISMMQNVLCRNFPSTPCELIMKDSTLQHLIEQSIEQIKFKQKTLEKFTQPPNYQQLTLLPVNSEDLSNFLKVSNFGFHTPKNNIKSQKKSKKSLKAKNFWSHEAPLKKKKSKTEVFNGRKIQKFYPHKIKYKDKKLKEFRDYSDEKLSMSVEVPESKTGITKRHYSYRNEQSDSPFWRIDYMKHGEPSVNTFGYEDSLKGKIVKTGPNVVVDDAIEQSARRDVLHPDVYIKKNYMRKSSVDANSGALE